MKAYRLSVSLEVFGHGRSSFTASVYQRLVGEMQMAVAEAVERRLSGEVLAKRLQKAAEIPD